MIASYCNNASDRIVLQLLHRWHMGWAGAHAFSTLASHQQGALTEQQQALHPQAAPQQQGLHWDQPRQQYQAILQQQQQRSADCSNKPQRPDQACNLLGITPEALRKVQEEEQRRQRFKVAATAVADQFTKTLGGKAAPAAAAALASMIADQTGVPTLLQVCKGNRLVCRVCCVAYSVCHYARCVVTASTANNMVSVCLQQGSKQLALVLSNHFMQG